MHTNIANVSERCKQMVEPLSKPLQARITAYIDAVLTTVESSSFMRGASGAELPDLTVCLGPGRCMIPFKEDELGECPFCVRKSFTRNMRSDAAIAAKRAIQGN